MIEFCLISTVRNGAPYVAGCVRSVLGQDYPHWTQIVVDDASTDGTGQAAREAAGDDPRVLVVSNAVRRYAVHSAIAAVHRYAPHPSVVCLLDGDDALSDPGALSAVAAEYERTGCDALWTAHANSDGTPGISRAMSGHPSDCAWTMSHLKTFRKPLIWGAPHDAIFADDGPWQRCGYDQAFYRPILCVARKPVFFSRVCYDYRVKGSTHRSDGEALSADQVEAQRGVIARLRNAARRFREKRRVALIVPGCAGADARFHIREIRHPIGALTLAARIRAGGHEVRLIDRWRKPGDFEGVNWADSVGVYASLPFWPDACAVFEKLKPLRQRRNGGKYLMAGGPAIMARPGLAQAWADLVCAGEADNTILDYLAYRQAGIDKPKRVRDLDSVPFPAYDLAREGYLRGWPYGKTEPVLAVSSSRGCPYDCSFCTTRDLLGRRWAGQSPERMALDAMEAKRLGYAGLYFREDNFACKRSRVERFCELVAPLGLKWACEIRADRACDPGIAERMAVAGCVGWYVGAESGSDRMLEIFRKRICRDQIDMAVTNAKRNKISIALSFIAGHPEETGEDRFQTHALVRQADHAWTCEFRSKVPVVAGIFLAHDEDAYVEQTLGHLTRQMPVYAVLDSPTPRVREVCERLARETFVWHDAPKDHVYRHKALLAFLKSLIDSDKIPPSLWFLRSDADEWWQDVEHVVNVAEGVGANVVDFPIRQLTPLCERANPADVADLRDLARPAIPADPVYLAPRGNTYERAWKRDAKVVLAMGGHRIDRPGKRRYEAATPFDHLPAYDLAGLRRKADRKVAPEERAIGWHIQYSGVAGRKVHIFFHVAKMGAWRDILASQLRMIQVTGLEAAADGLHVVTVGDSSSTGLSVKWDQEHGGAIDAYEFPTLSRVWRHACAHPDDVILYLHTKGVHNCHPHTRAWREYMMWGCVERWQRCVEAIRNGYDLAGVEWLEGTSLRRFGCRHPQPVGFFAGNFWWGGARYLATLPDPLALKMSVRWYAEAWPGLGKDPRYLCFFDTRRKHNGKHGWELPDWSRSDYTQEQRP